jgi:hypothetical protein
VTVPARDPGIRITRVPALAIRRGDQMNMALVIERTCQGSPSARSARTIHPLGALEGV